MGEAVFGFWVTTVTWGKWRKESWKSRGVRGRWRAAFPIGLLREVLNHKVGGKDICTKVSGGGGTS